MSKMAFSEAEYSILLKRIDTYSSFLSNCIDEYKGILDYMMEYAIHDDKITAKILKLKSDVSLYSNNLEEIKGALNGLVLKFGYELQQKDRINLPDNEMSIIKTLLKAFQ